MTDPAVPPPAPQYAAAPVTFPGKGLGIAGLILAIFLPLIGFIVSLVARSQSKKAGFANTPATVGIIIGLLLIVVGIIVSIALGVTFATLASQCAQLGSGVHDTGNGVTITCG